MVHSRKIAYLTALALCLILAIVSYKHFVPFIRSEVNSESDEVTASDTNSTMKTRIPEVEESSSEEEERDSTETSPLAEIEIEEGEAWLDAYLNAELQRFGEWESRDERENGPGVEFVFLEAPDQGRGEVFFPQDLLELTDREREIQAFTDGVDSFLPGVVRRGVASGGTDSEDALAEDESDDEDTLPRVAGQPRGYTMLYLMQPEARGTVERQVEALLRSQLKEVYLGVLTDGTFGKDYQYLLEVMERLSADERELTLVLYLTNGATMRNFAVTAIEAPFVDRDPIQFNRDILSDEKTREEFQLLVNEVAPIVYLNYNQYENNQTLIVPMLEDNLTDEAFLAMRDIVQEVLGGTAEVIRNPCKGCYSGSESGRLGGAIEWHKSEELAEASGGDGYSLDGVGYHFPGESAALGLSLAAVERLMKESVSRGVRYFGLWRFARQGTSEDPNSTRLKPNLRNYEYPTNVQLDREVQLLRSGLDEVLLPDPVERIDEEFVEVR